LREIYERQHNLDAEHDVASRWAACYGLAAVKREALDHFDYDMLNPLGVRLATVEIKCRNASYLSMIERDGYMISANRYNNQLIPEQRKGVPVLLLVGIAGAVYVLPIRRAAPLVSVVGGRTVQTRDKYDVEEVVLIPWEWFTKLVERG
jgi:hypothetical protein